MPTWAESRALLAEGAGGYTPQGGNAGTGGRPASSVSSERQMLRAHDERNRDKCSWCHSYLVVCVCPDRDDPYLLDGGTVGTEHEQ